MTEYLIQNPISTTIIVVLALVLGFVLLWFRKVQFKYKDLELGVQKNGEDIQRLKTLPRLISVLYRKVTAAIKEIPGLPPDRVLEVYNLGILWLCENNISDTEEFIKRKQEAVLDILDKEFRIQYNDWVCRCVRECIIALYHEKELLENGNMEGD